MAGLRLTPSAWLWALGPGPSPAAASCLLPPLTLYSGLWVRPCLCCSPPYHQLLAQDLAHGTCQRLITSLLIRDMKPMFHVLHDCRLQRTVPRPLGGERLELHQHVDPTDPETSASRSPKAPSNPGRSTPGPPGRRGQPAHARHVQDPPAQKQDRTCICQTSGRRGT